MKGKTKKIILAVAVIGAVAAGGVAFTDTNAVDATAAGYGSAAVTGATATSIHHTLSADGTTIVSTAMTLTGNIGTTPVVKAGFGAVATLDTCVNGATGGTGAASTVDVVCTYAVAPTTAAETTFHVAVTN